jgi:hypothetical protein
MSIVNLCDSVQIIEYAANGGTYISSGTVKLYEDQRATTMMDILSENRKKILSKLIYRALKARVKRFCARRLLLYKQNS